jgi:hypothetical protein
VPRLVIATFMCVFPLAALTIVMAGLDPAIHVVLSARLLRRGCPAQGRA